MPRIDLFQDWILFGATKFSIIGSKDDPFVIQAHGHKLAAFEPLEKESDEVLPRPRLRLGW